MFRTISQFIFRDSFITPAIYVWYSFKYISWVDKMPLTVLRFGHCISYFMLAIYLLVVVLQPFKKFMIPRCSLPCSQQLAAWPYPETNRSISRHAISSKTIFNIIVLSTPLSSKWPLSLGFPHQIHAYISLLSHTCHMPRTFPTF